MTHPTDTAADDPLSAILADACARLYGLRAAWLWRCVGRGLVARGRGFC
jgi:hypothetical protein